MNTDGSIVVDVNIDNENAQKDLNDLNKSIGRTQNEIEKLNSKRNPLADQAREYGAELDAAKAKLEALKTEQAAISATLSPTLGNNPDVTEYADAWSRQNAVAAELKQQQSAVDKIQGKWDSVQNKIEDYDYKIKLATASLTAQQTEAGRLAEKLVQSADGGEKLNQALKKVENTATKVVAQSSAATETLREIPAAAGAAQAQVVKTGAEASAAMEKAQVSAEKFKRRILSLAQSALIFSVITAALTKFRQYMGKALKTNDEFNAQLAKLRAAWLTAFQPVYEFVLPAVLAVMRVLTTAANLITRVVSIFTGKSPKDYAESAKAMNAEANAIDSVGTAAKNAKKQLAGFDEINKLDDTSADSGGGIDTGIADTGEGFDTQPYKDKIDELAIYIGGAMLGLGAILAFSGANIPLGIALMALGAVALVAVISENWKEMSDRVKGAITIVALILGAAALVIGAILAFSGVKTGLGIALIAVGAASLVAAAALNWDSIIAALKGPMGKTLAYACNALLVLGLLLACSGVALGLGIALIAAGAVGLVAIAALNWNKVVDALKGPMGKTVAMAAGFLIVIGLMLAFSGVSLPLGIALIAAGAVGLATVTALNWDTAKGKIRSTFAGILAVVSGALIAVGILLCLSGVGIGLGLAVLAAGLAGSYAAWKIDDNPVTRFVKKLANGVIGILNSIITKINDMFHVSFKGLKLLGKTVIPAFDQRLVNIPQIPYLAQGAVIPPNREFMAVLGDQKSGTNIETPLATMIEAFKTAMADGSFSGTVVIPIYLDGKRIANYVIDINDKKAFARNGAV